MNNPMIQRRALLQVLLEANELIVTAGKKLQNCACFLQQNDLQFQFQQQLLEEVVHLHNHLLLLAHTPTMAMDALSAEYKPENEELN